MRNQDQLILETIAKIIRKALKEDLPPFLVQQKRNILDAAGDYGGRSPWEPLRPATVEIKSKLKKVAASDVRRPMMRTRKLYNSFKAKATSSAKDYLSFEVSNSARYAEEQDHGGTAPSYNNKVKQPENVPVVARPFFEITVEDTAEIAEEIERIIIKALQNASD